jgi:hypothetical protein
VVGRGEGVEGADVGSGEDAGVLLVGVGAEVVDVQATAAVRPNATSTAHHTPRRPSIEQYCALPLDRAPRFVIHSGKSQRDQRGGQMPGSV